MMPPGAKPLTESDYDRLTGIDRHIIEQARLQRVDSFEGSQIVGRNGRGDYAGIIFPYCWPGDSHAREYRLRRDHPEMESDAHGKLKPKDKYLSPPGRGNLLYFPPGIQPAWLADPKVTVVITEGEKKTLALHSLAWHGLSDTADHPGWVSIGLAGAWNWKGTIGKTETADGVRVDVKGVIPDFNRIEWKGRAVKIIFDANVHSNEKVEWARKSLAAALRKLGAIVSLVDIPESAGVNGVDDLVGIWGKQKVLDLINASKPEAAAKPQASDVRPRIRVSNRQLHEVAEESRLALKEWNSPPRLFSMGSRKVHLNESQGDTQDVVTVDLNEHSIRDYMSRSADYVKVTKEGDEVNVFPLPDLARNLLHKQNEELGLPPLEGVVSAPVVLRDGRILDRRGYDAGSALYYLPPARLNLEALPESCDGQAARAAREFIELELLSNFPFSDESSKTHALAALLTPLVRHSMRLAPMVAIDATASSSGKGLFSKLICLVATGQTANTRGLEGDEAEIRKSISSALMGNQAGMIVFDNVTGTVRSSALDRALTTEVWRDRELGHSRDICAKQKACWFLTGNNVTIAGDLMRRICRIRLDPKMSRAYLRNPDLFRHQDIETWTLENRNQILIALLTMIRAWWQADCPRPTVRPLGSFEEWTRMVGGILEFSGATDFLANFTSNVTDMDSEDMDWSYWLQELARAYPNGFTVPKLLEDLDAYENKSNRVRTLVPNAVAAYLDGKKGASAAGLGMVLKYRKERRYLYADPDNPEDQTDFWLEPMSEKRPVVWTVKKNDVSPKH